MNTNIENYDHDQASLLLPWLVNETLSEAERTAVEFHVAACEECRTDVRALQQLQAGIRNDALTPIVPKADPARLLDALDGENAVESREAGDRRWLVPAVIAASIVVAIAVVLSIGLKPPEPLIYETATGDVPIGSMDYVLSVSFASQASEQQRQAVFESVKATDLSHDGGDSYKVTIRLQAASMEQLQTYTDQVRAMAGVESADVVAIQLPMRKDQ